MVEEIKNSDAEKALKGKLSVIDFNATWCGPCRMLAPIIEELSDEMDGRVDFYAADVDENRELAYQFDIVSIPAVIVLSDGEEAARSIGFQPKEELKKIIESCEK